MSSYGQDARFLDMFVRQVCFICREHHVEDYTRYDVYVGMLKRWDRKGKNTIYVLNGGDKNELRLSSLKGFLLYSSLYDFAWMKCMPRKLWANFYRQISPYRIPLWNENLKSNVLAMSQMFPDFERETERYTITGQGDEPLQMTMV